ncbi:ABC transporter ATP-binding protein/permease [Actinomyces gaoshouyii]|uniref:ABC transporter ATP-binding protein/permease n=1 Tax=Actinomyces gaoshouyii TaxID=1960083 RepID=UPI0009B53280|nr:ABC transporter ATP-binding protein [Actinomyces gaoshouyii]
MPVFSGPGPSPTRIPLATPSSKRANLASFCLTVLASLAQGWSLISAGRALGALIDGTTPAALLASALLSGTASALAAAGARAVSLGSAAREEAALRRRVLAHLMGLGPARAARQRTGSTVSVLTDGAERVALYRQTFLAPTIAAGLAPALVLAELAIAVDPLPSTVLTLAVVGVPTLIIGFHRTLRSSSSGSRRSRARLSAEYLDAIQGLTTLTLARAARRTHERLCEAGEGNRRAVMRLLAGNQLVILVTDSLFSLFLISVAAVSAVARLGSGAIGVGDALAIVLTSFVLLEPLDHVGAFFYVGMGGQANQRVIRRILSSSDRSGAAALGGPRQADATGAREPAGQSGLSGAPGAGPSGAIRLREASAAWGRAEVLHGIDLEVAPGEHVAVVGPSGSGKSTLTALLKGDLLPSGGAVEVDGEALAPGSGAAEQERVRAASALVAQSTWLFSGTIASNLRLAAPSAGDDELWEALTIANLAEEVRGMPQGLATRVGERGLGLSGGQAQRVSLARAVLADRPVLLLDEPTSQVDLAGEAVIIEAIERVSKGRTVITVSHRAGALSGADRVITIEGGRLIATEPGARSGTGAAPEAGHGAGRGER